METPPTTFVRLLPDIGSADQFAHAGEFRAHGHGQLIRRPANDLEAEFGQPCPYGWILQGRATISGGVCAGTSSAHQGTKLKPGTISATVGTSGNWLAREDVLVAKRRTRLSVSSGTTEDMPAPPPRTCGATISSTPAVAPRLGTWVIPIPAARPNSSVATCCGLPMPPDA